MNGQISNSGADGAGCRGHGNTPNHAGPPSPANLVRTVAAAFAVTAADLQRPSRGRFRVARARQTGIYLARVAFGLTLSDAGRMFGRDRTTAAHACRVVEDLRDNASFDQLLTAIEDALRAQPRGARQ